MKDYISEVFGDGGLFASHFPGYERRNGQVALARMVDAAMSSGRHALGEGPCGTGKGQAYCVPAVWHAHHEKKRVVIATPNIALQEQLVGKDLPLLQKVVPWEFSFKLLKGRNNFVCKDRVEVSRQRKRLTNQDWHQPEIDRVLAWLDMTERGDVSELPFVPERKVWSRFAVSSDECKRSKCRFAGSCFYEREKAEAMSADIVVTNFHMLFAHLAIRRETELDLVLPPFDLLVLDEAHEAAAIAREFFGFTLSEVTFKRLVSATHDFGLHDIADSLEGGAEVLFDDLSYFGKAPENRKRLRSPGFVNSAASLLQIHLDDLLNVTEREILNAMSRAATARSRGDRKAEDLAKNVEANATVLHRRAKAIKQRMLEGNKQSDQNKAYWLDVDSYGRAKLCAKPVDVSTLLRQELFESCPSVTLVSATLTTQGTFDFVRREVGVPDSALEIIAETPFDFENQALLVIPEVPFPGDAGFVEEASRVFQDVVDACDGRTLGLFTSYRNLNAFYERVDKTHHRVLRQGELPRAELTRLFKEDVGSILLGTESFWTGIDVAGEALTGLVIDKLPFPRPDDPVIEAIRERDGGMAAFFNYEIPLAIIALRQGVGRLIRSKSDVGVVVILDSRIVYKGYGKLFLKSLGLPLRTRRVENITRFLKEAAYARAS